MLFITVLAFLQLCIWVQLCQVSICTQVKTSSIYFRYIKRGKTQVRCVNYSLLGPLLGLVLNFQWTLYCNLFSFVLSVSLASKLLIDVALFNAVTSKTF